VSYLLFAGVVLVLLLWGTAAARVWLRQARWRITTGAFSLGVFAAAAFVTARGGWPEGLLLGVIGLLLALSTRWPRASPTAPRPDSRMSVEEARAILGVTPNATPAEIRAAYSRLMRMAHPDQGGTTGLAAQLNVARDRLLRP
jgi:DnaJ-domain-containing protein 1